MPSPMNAARRPRGAAAAPDGAPGPSDPKTPGVAPGPRGPVIGPVTRGRHPAPRSIRGGRSPRAIWTLRGCRSRNSPRQGQGTEDAHPPGGSRPRGPPPRRARPTGQGARMPCRPCPGRLFRRRRATGLSAGPGSPNRSASWAASSCIPDRAVGIAARPAPASARASADGSPSTRGVIVSDQMSAGRPEPGHVGQRRIVVIAHPDAGDVIPEKPINQASRAPWVVPVLPAICQPSIAARRPVPRSTT